ncbi:MAG: MBOAT family protein [Ruminococcaceae bacterium]|nr:MBOAT family protein [Oscillospiraceae bacterium]
MLFSSFGFLFLFLPLCLAVYLVCPPRLRYAVLLVFSLIFYGVGEPRFLPLLLLSGVAHYFFGRVAAKKRLGVWLAVGFDLVLLAFFKYYDALAAALGWSVLGLSLPLGLSFYSFSALSYVIDVSRGEAVEKNPLRFGASFTFFPKLLSGPIARYGSLREALSAPKTDSVRASRGIGRFVCGLSKKLLLAVPLGEAWEYFFAMDFETRGVLGAWLALVFFALRLYYDFSGYTDMALGLGEILGVPLPENFNYPYTAESPRDFWRRWHITLSVWFRDYVYIPLGGSRCRAWRVICNLLVVWVLTGLWHGSTLNFLLWGLFWFLLLSLGRTPLGALAARLPRAWRRLLMIPVILVSWLIFAVEDLSLGARFFGSLFGGPFLTALTRYELLRLLPLLLVAIVGATPRPKAWFDKHARGGWLSPALAVGGFLVSLVYLTGGTQQSFLYLRF